MFNKRQVIIVIIPQILKAVIAAGLALAIIFFISARITKIGVTLNEKKAMTTVLQKRSETTATLRHAFSTIGESSKKIQDAFPTTDNILEFVSAVETIGNQNSMQLALRFATPEVPLVETPTISIVPVGYTITANGTVTTLSNYIRQFEELTYFAGVKSITISTGSLKGWEDGSVITIQGTLYTKKSL